MKPSKITIDSSPAPSKTYRDVAFRDLEVGATFYYVVGDECLGPYIKIPRYRVDGRGFRNANHIAEERATGFCDTTMVQLDDRSTEWGEFDEIPNNSHFVIQGYHSFLCFKPSPGRLASEFGSEIVYLFHSAESGQERATFRYATAKPMSKCRVVDLHVTFPS